MNELMTKLKATFEQKQSSIAQRYWESIGDSSTDPEVLLQLAGSLGKDLEAIADDAKLLLEIKTTVEPDAKAVEKTIKKTLDKAWKLAGEAAKLADEVQIKRHEAEALRAKANAVRSDLDAQQRGYKALVRRLAQAGHPEYQNQVIELEEARQKDREAKAKAAEITRLKSLLGDAKESFEAFKVRAMNRDTDDVKEGLKVREAAIRKLEQELEAFGVTGPLRAHPLEASTRTPAFN